MYAYETVRAIKNSMPFDICLAALRAHLHYYWYEQMQAMIRLQCKSGLKPCS